MGMCSVVVFKTPRYEAACCFNSFYSIIYEYSGNTDPSVSDHIWVYSYQSIELECSILIQLLPVFSRFLT